VQKVRFSSEIARIPPIRDLFHVGFSPNRCSLRNFPNPCNGHLPFFQSRTVRPQSLFCLLSSRSHFFFATLQCGRVFRVLFLRFADGAIPPASRASARGEGSNPSKSVLFPLCARPPPRRKCIWVMSPLSRISVRDHFPLFNHRPFETRVINSRPPFSWTTCTMMLALESPSDFVLYSVADE